MSQKSRLLRASDRFYAWLLHAYPGDFRQEYASEMSQVFRDCCRTAYARRQSWGILSLWLPTLGDLALTAFEERTKENGMNALSTEDFERHVTRLGWLFLLGHALFLLITGGLYLTLLLQNAGAISGQLEATAALGALTLVSLPGIFAGYGLLRRRRWARILALGIAFLELQTFPIGTLFGLVTFWVLLQQSAADSFAPGISAQA